MKKKSSIKKIVTIEDLAIMVQNGFKEQGDKIYKLDSRFDILENRFDILENRFDTLEGKVNGLDKSMFDIQLKLDSLDERMKNIENILGPLVMVVEAMKTSFKDHEIRILKLERQLQRK